MTWPGHVRQPRSLEQNFCRDGGLQCADDECRLRPPAEGTSSHEAQIEHLAAPAVHNRDILLGQVVVLTDLTPTGDGSIVR